MNFKDSLSRKPILASIVLSIYRKKFIIIRKDLDGDFEIRANGISLFSSSPFSWFDATHERLFTYGYTCRPGDNAIIVGVEDGLELTYYCAKCNPGFVIAVEPTKACVRRLNKLKEKNNLTNLIVVETAAGDRNIESVPFATSGDTERDLTNTLAEFDKTYGKVVARVSLTRLENIIDLYKIDRVDFLKINVEGAELLVLEGLGKYAHDIGNICLSCHDFIAPSLRTYDEAILWFKENNYEILERDFFLERPWENYYLYARKTAMSGIPT